MGSEVKRGERTPVALVVKLTMALVFSVVAFFLGMALWYIPAVGGLLSFLFQTLLPAAAFGASVYSWWHYGDICPITGKDIDPTNDDN